MQAVGDVNHGMLECLSDRCIPVTIAVQLLSLVDFIIASASGLSLGLYVAHCHTEECVAGNGTEDIFVWFLCTAVLSEDPFCLLIPVMARYLLCCITSVAVPWVE